MDLLKIFKIYLKDTVKRMERQATKWEKIYLIKDSATDTKVLCYKPRKKVIRDSPGEPGTRLLLHFKGGAG